MSEKQRIAMVTGAGSGIGRAVAIALAKEGYAVVLTGRTAGRLDDTASSIKVQKGLSIAFAADVSDPEAVQALFSKTKAEFGRLDLLFNNAGVFAPSVPLDELPFEQWKASVDINLTGSFLCTQAAFHMMRYQDPQGGRIINNGSISAQVPRPMSIAYTATKHAVTGLTKSTALDGRAFNIACGQIDIGNAATDMTAKMKKGVPQANGTTAAEPTMDVENVTRAVVYMASLPLNANVLSMNVMATNMPFVGRG